MEIDILMLITIAALLLCFFIGILCALLVITSSPMPRIIRFEDEKYYLDPLQDPPIKKKFPYITEAPSVDLSVIIPAYNEETRLPPMLDECIEFLEERIKKTSSYLHEIIVVDDGSRDQTSKVALNYAKKYGTEKIRVLKLIKNRGKGGAVRLGMLSARGKNLLLADADGATKFCDIEKLEGKMDDLSKNNTNVVIVGSRAHLEQQAIATRSIFRTILMYGFHALVWLFGVRNVRDTQCGFKLLNRKAAHQLFTSLHVERWAFDVELLYLAHQMDMQIGEVAVNWTEIEGSKLVPFWSWLQMGTDLVIIWLRYQTGAWKIAHKSKDK